MELAFGGSRCSFLCLVFLRLSKTIFMSYTIPTIFIEIEI